CAIVASDTGATAARVLAAHAPKRVTKLVVLNTEIPGHRPPWIQLYQKLMAVPGAELVLRGLRKSRTFVRSSAGFGGCFADPARLDDEDWQRATFAPLLERKDGLRGAIRYLRGIDWDLVDRLPEIHAAITAQTLFLWGADDETFPLERAQIMPP